jgi:hypothetical protein
MPWLSRQQQRWGHTPSGLKALGGPAKVAEWDQASRGMKLPRIAAPRKPRSLKMKMVPLKSLAKMRLK